MYTVLEKDLRTQKILTVSVFKTFEEATHHVEKKSSIWIEDRGYKIVEG